MELTIEITTKCQQECPWCSSSAGKSGWHVPLETVFSWLQMEMAMADPVVRISGGEPVLHPDLEKIALEARRLGYRVTLMTNGLHILDNRVLRLLDAVLVNIVSERSLDTVDRYCQFLSVEVGMQVVLVEGNEYNLLRALDHSMVEGVLLRLLVLQKQGRGEFCEPLDDISWTGDKGCHKEDKVTITPGGERVTCSALKYGECRLSESLLARREK